MPQLDSAARRHLLTLAAAAAALPAAHAQTREIQPAVRRPGDWPNKPIRIVVAFPPGGLTDAYARLYAEQLTAKFGATAVVDNKPGAGAIIGIDAFVAGEGDDAFDVEVGGDGAFALTDEVGFVGLEAVHAEPVFLGEDGDRRNSEFVGGSEDADGDLGSVGRHQLAERARSDLGGGGGGLGSRRGRGTSWHIAAERLAGSGVPATIFAAW